MPAFVPAIQPWSAFTGDYTVSSDLETMTIPASPMPAVRSPWYDMGAGATLAKIAWDGTASGTVQGRATMAVPSNLNSLIPDLCPLQPSVSEWGYAYDAALGTAPGSQGLTKNGTITETYPTATSFRLQTTGGYYSAGSTPNLSASADMTIVRVGFKINTGHTGLFECYYDDGTKRFVWYVTGSSFGGSSNKLLIAYALSADVATVPYDTWCDVVWVVRRSSGTITDARMYFRERGSNTNTDLVGFTDVGKISLNSSGGNLAGFGNGLSGGGCDVTIDVAGWYSGTEWETVTDGDTSFAANRRYWEFRGWQDGTLTELDVASDLTPPGNPSGPEAAAIGSTAIGGNCTSTASGASAYYAECLDADNSDAVLQADWTLNPCHAFRGLSGGNYKVRFTSASDDGVRGSSSVTSSSTAVPAITPSIAVTVSPVTVSAGNTAAATATITGATATLNGSAWNGSSTTVVTGVQGSTPTPPVIGPVPAWVNGELRFYKPTAGSLGLTGGRYDVLYASAPAGPYTLAVTANWNDLTWRASDGTGQYVTDEDLGLIVDPDDWYRGRVTDTGNLSSEHQSAVYGGDSGERYCVVRFTGLTAGAVVSARLSSPVNVRGATLAVGPYTATVGLDGTASLLLPRCDAGTAADGAQGAPFAYITGGNPEAWVLPRRIPDAASADFTDLLSLDAEWVPTGGVVRSGEGPPDDALGEPGDCYIDTLTGVVYQLGD